VKKVTISTLLLVMFAVSAAGAQQSVFPDKARILSLKQNPGWAGLQAACTAGLGLQSNPFAVFSPPPHYDAKGPVAERDDAPIPSLQRDSMAVYHLALCFELSKDNKYSTKAEAILNSWAHTTKTIGSDQGKDGFNFYFPYALMGAYLLRHDANWSGGDLDTFVRTIVIPANNADKPNNHANWGVLLLASAGGYLEDPAVLRQARARWLELMKSQVAEDGSLPLEICRSDTSNWCGGETKGIKGIAYTHYALLPTTIAAEIFLNEGQSVYSTPEGALYCKAYTRAANWTLHPETFPYYKSNKGKLIGLYNIDYFYIAQQRCPNADGATALKKYESGNGGTLELRALYGW
jgi:hypothetical protein